MPSSRAERHPPLAWFRQALPRPTDASHLHLGLYYKIGRFGKVYYWDGHEWRLSTKPVDALYPLDTPDACLKAYHEVF